MPKQVITSDVQIDPKAVHVGWRKNVDVEIATIRPDDAAETGARGEFISLDRTAINRLIRALRRARDQAFGADA